jgi:hypothetical protein
MEGFLVSEADLSSVDSAFDRAIIYPDGGHLGNLWYPANRRAMLDVLRTL